jgi:phage gp37-like protein
MLATIEDAMIARFKATLTYLKSVESYAGQLDDETFDSVRVMPALWIAFAGLGTPKQLGADRFLTPATFAVMCCVRSVRGEKTARRGGAAPGDVGVYHIMRDVRQLLLMQDLGLAIEHFRPGPMKTIFNTKLKNGGLAVYSYEWHTKFIDNVAGHPMVGGAPVEDVMIGGVPFAVPIVDGQQVTTPPGELAGVGMEYRLRADSEDPDATDSVTLST